MKKFVGILAFVCLAVSLNAQHRVNSFFDELGTVRIETQELDENADTIATIFHRTDDVVWSRVVYRIIDMRFKQNYQLYFPTNPNDPKYWSLFRLILDAVVNGRENNQGQVEYLNLYNFNDKGIKPIFADSMLVPRDRNMQAAFGVDKADFLDMDDPDGYLVLYDSLTNTISYNDYGYANFIRNQVKYVTMEVVFFNKHMSRFYTKLIAIAPLYAPLRAGQTIYEQLYSQVMFWILFDELRPFLARQYMIPTNNSSIRMTFDNFFAEHLYSSYIIGDDNMYDRIIAQGKGVKGSQLSPDFSEEWVHREQQRIADELLNTELDLWEY